MASGSRRSRNGGSVTLQRIEHRELHVAELAVVESALSARPLVHAKKSRIGTITAQLGLHHTTVQRVLRRYLVTIFKSFPNVTMCGSKLSLARKAPSSELLPNSIRSLERANLR